MKTMNKEKGVHLPPWSEVIGVYHALRNNGSFTFIMIGKKSVVFPRDSVEAELARKQLNRKLLKRKIGMLRTDPNTGHLFVRIMEKREALYDLPSSDEEGTFQAFLPRQKRGDRIRLRTEQP